MTGWTGAGASKSDKKVRQFNSGHHRQLNSTIQIGVVGLTMFDQRRLGKVRAFCHFFKHANRFQVDKLSMVGTNGSKFPAIRKHLDENIGKVYKDMDTSFVAFPAEGEIDAEAYKTAIDKMSPGDAVIVFTPDSTHIFPALTLSSNSG
jgi:D-galacturonate reductase